MRGNMKLAVAAGAVLLIAGYAAPAQAGECRDPWVSQVVRKYSGEPSGPGDPRCNISNYNNGRWGNFGELDAAARRYFTSFSGMTGSTIMSLGSGRIRVSTSYLSGLQSVRLIGSMDRGYRINGDLYRLISNDGSSVVLEKIVAQGGGNVASSGQTYRMSASALSRYTPTYVAGYGNVYNIGGQNYQLISNDGSSVVLRIILNGGAN
jgi:hypothetical protein